MPRINLSPDDLRDLRAGAENKIDNVLDEVKREGSNNSALRIIAEKRELIRRIDRILAQEPTP